MREMFKRWAWRGYRDSTAQLHELRNLSWVATRRCNLACVHCALSCDSAGSGGAELSTQEAKALFSSLAEDFSPRRIGISVTGGEPLLRPDLFEVAAHINSLGFSWGLSTNGMLVNAHVLELCSTTGLRAVSVSLDGPPEVHEALRGPGTYRPAVAAVEHFARLGSIPLVEVAACLTPQLVQRLDMLYNLAGSLGVNRLRLMPVAPRGRAAGATQLRLSVSQMRAALDWLAYKRRNVTAHMQVVFDEAGYIGEPYEGVVREGNFMCTAGISGAAVLADGTVTGCAFLGSSFAQGNIREQPFSRIWDTGFKRLRDRRWMRRGPCAECQSFVECGGGCLLQWTDAQAGGPCSCMAQDLRQQR